MEVHELDWERDPDAELLATLLNRSRYGPVVVGQPLTPLALRELWRERGPGFAFGAFAEERLVGSLTFLDVSGRRGTQNGSLWVGPLVIDPHHRNSMVAPKLFLAGFQDVLARGYRTLRTDVNPANRSALEIYLRAGFSPMPGARANEEDLLELISHLPGVIRDVMATEVGQQLRAALPTFSWRNASPRRPPEDGQGPGMVNGRYPVTYRLRAAGLTQDVTVDLASGAPMPAEGPVAPITADEADTPGVIHIAAVGETGRLEVDQAGTLRLFLEGHPGPVLIDPFPVILGWASIGWRRPRRISAAVEVRQGEVTIEHGEPPHVVRRVVTVRGEEVTVRTRAVSGEGGGQLTVAPWVALRLAEKYVWRDDDRPVGGPVVRGLWPRALTDFEAAVALEPAGSGGTAVLWRSPFGCLHATWDRSTMVRHEGLHLPLMRSTGAATSYTLRLERSCRANGTEPPRPLVEVPGRSPRAQVDGVDWRELEWRAGIRRQGEELTAALGRHALRYVGGAGGIVSWTADGAEMLRCSFPARRPLGALAEWSAGLWFGVAEPRESPEQGVEWVEPAMGRPPITDRTTLDAAGWLLAGDADGAGTALLITGRGSADDRGRDLAFYLTPAHRAGGVVLLTQELGTVWAMDAPSTPWTVSARALGLELKSGRFLVIAPEEAVMPEIFAKSVDGNIILFLLVRAAGPWPSIGSWTLEVADDRSHAVALVQQHCGRDE